MKWNVENKYGLLTFLNDSAGISNLYPLKPGTRVSCVVNIMEVDVMATKEPEHLQQ